MDINAIRLVLLAAVVGLTACGTQSGNANEGSKAGSNEPCVPPGQNVDSSVVLAQARRALSLTASESAASLVQAVQDKGVDLGALVSLVLSAPNAPAGGGGLVWVDGDTGCTIVLRRYE